MHENILPYKEVCTLVVASSSLLMCMGKSQCTNAGMHECIIRMLAAELLVNQLNLKEICLRLYRVSAETQVMEHCDGGELLKAWGEYEGQYEGRYGVGIPSEV